MVRRVARNFSSVVTRSAANTFQGMKPGDALKARKLAPHIYETRAEARLALTAGIRKQGGD